MHFSEDYIEKVREANDIVEIIGRHTVFKQGGRSLMGLCPFPDHAEKSPSFSVSADKQLYHCFGCGKSGNIYSFLRDFYGYSFIESIEYLAKKAGVPLPQEGHDTKEQSKSLLQKKEQKKILSLSLEFFRLNLTNVSSEHLAKKYLSSRGFGSEEVINKLNIGWAKDEWSTLTDYLQSKKIDLSLAEDLGLIKPKKEGGYYDTFRGRVIFPVFSFSGEVLGFGGRVLNDDKPKYLNSPESSFFKKSKILYGQNWASSEIRRFDEALIVEGYTDWAALYIAGIKNGLGTMGTALTEEHAKRIKRWCSKVVCIFDGDEAGQRASERALAHLLKEGVLARGVFLPQGEDPDSYIKNNGAERLQADIKNARDLFLTLLDDKLKNFGGQVYEKIEALKWAAETLKNLDSKSPLFAIYIPEIESRLKIGERTIKEELKKVFSGKATKLEPSVPPQAEPSLEAEPLQKVQVKLKKNHPEMIILSLMMENHQIMETLEQKNFVFSDFGAQFLWEKLRSKYRQPGVKPDSVEAHLANFVSNPGVLTLTMEKPYCNLSKEQKYKLFEDCFAAVEKKRISAQTKQITKKMGHDVTEDELKQFMELQRKKRKRKSSDEIEPS